MDKESLEAKENTKTQASYIIELLARLLAADASFLTAREKILFLKKIRSLTEEEFALLTLDDISFCVKRTFSRVKWNAKDSLKKVKIAQKIMNAQRISATCILDSDFPALLRLIPDPPFLLFYRGNLEILKKKCVSVVGTRRASVQANRAASDFAKEACDDGLCVVSGLAFGIDAAAHKGALLSQFPATCAVLPSGIDTITPHSHTRLAAKILERGGLLLSEYLPGTPAVQFRYVQRNRIVASLSPATLVVQAPTGSGAMITASLALDYNRDVFFHNECFSQEALAINEFSELQWKKVVAQGKKNEYKMNCTPKAFVEDGASVVHTYEEFKKVSASLPFPCENTHGYLFDDLEN